MTEVRLNERLQIIHEKIGTEIKQQVEVDEEERERGRVSVKLDKDLHRVEKFL